MKKKVLYFFFIYPAVRVSFLFVWLCLKQEELTPEEQQLEKLRVQKLQEAADLELAKDAFGM